MSRSCPDTFATKIFLIRWRACRNTMSLFSVTSVPTVCCFTPHTWLHGKRTPNRLKLLKEWTEAGGGLAMCGGYLTFQGINGSGRYHRTPVEVVLPVTMHPYDDWWRCRKCVSGWRRIPDHPILDGVSGEWPPLLGLNEVTVKEDAQLLATCGDYPLLAVAEVGRGRSLAWTSDIGPHWCPAEFLAWDGLQEVLGVPASTGWRSVCNGFRQCPVVWGRRNQSRPRSDHRVLYLGFVSLGAIAAAKRAARRPVDIARVATAARTVVRRTKRRPDLCRRGSGYDRSCPAAIRLARRPYANRRRVRRRQDAPCTTSPLSRRKPAASGVASLPPDRGQI